MSHPTGSIYKIEGRRYIDSQGVYRLAGAHEVVPLHDGWRVMVGGGAIHCALVENRPELPRQRGAVYALTAVGGVSLKAEHAAWLSRGLVQPGGTFDTWPGDPPGKASCGCGETCGCAPCRARYAHHHEHEEKTT